MDICENIIFHYNCYTNVTRSLRLKKKIPWKSVNKIRVSDTQPNSQHITVFVL